MVKNKKIIAGTAVAVALVAGFFAYNGVKYNNIVKENRFLPNTTIQIGDYETDASLKTVDDIYNEYMSSKTDELVILSNNQEYNYDVSKLYQHSVTTKSLQDETKKQQFGEYILRKNNSIEIEDSCTYTGDSNNVYNEYIKDVKEILTLTLKGKQYAIDISKYFSHKLTKNELDNAFSAYDVGEELKVTDNTTYNGGAEEEIQNFFDTTEYDYTETKDAEIDLETLVVKQEVQGDEIDIEKAIQDIVNGIKNGIFNISLDDEKYYKKPQVTKEELETQYKDLFKLAEWYVSYDKDLYNYTIKMADYMTYVTLEGEGKFSVDYSFLKDAVYGLSKQLDSYVNDSMTFKASNGETIEVKGGTYGRLMYDAKECEVLEEMIKEGKIEENRQPEWKLSPTEKENPQNYVEVSIGEQHVWHYKNGELCCESDCVTGTKGGHDTPTGVFYISEKDPGCYLRGADYKTWVDRWMRLTGSGVGLHDANWRGSFGGKIYTYNGSHGCINLPPKFAYHIYDTCPLYTMVVVH